MEIWYPRDAGHDKEQVKNKRDNKYAKFSKLAKSVTGGVYDASKSHRGVVVKKAYSGKKFEIRLIHNKKDYMVGKNGLSATNLDSALTFVRFGKFSALLCADALGDGIAGAKATNAIKGAVKSMPGKSVDFLQVSHHGMIGMVGKGGA